MDLVNKIIYVIDHPSKTYVETSLPLDMSKVLPPEAVAGRIKITGVKVTPNGQTKTVGEWNCRGYDFDMDSTMMKMKSFLWVTQDVPFDWKHFSQEVYLNVMKVKMSEMNIGHKFIKEFKKIEGFPVASEMNIMGMNITSTVVEISKKSAPAGIYAPPEGYTKIDKLTITK